MERGRDVVGLAGSVHVKGLQIHRSSWFTVLLCADDHLVAPGDWFSNRDRFDDAQADILIEAGLDWLPPMNRNWDGGVVSHGFRIGVDHEGHGWTVHKR